MPFTQLHFGQESAYARCTNSLLPSEVMDRNFYASCNCRGGGETALSKITQPCFSRGVFIAKFPRIVKTNLCATQEALARSLPHISSWIPSPSPVFSPCFLPRVWSKMLQAWLSQGSQRGQAAIKK